MIVLKAAEQADTQVHRRGKQTEILRDFAAEKGVKAGALINGARVALTGQGVAPSLFAVMVALGKRRTIDRLGNVESLASRVLVPKS